MMQQIIEFFRGIFDIDRWPPRWHCGYWSDFHGWLYIISDLMIWLAYFLIPAFIIEYFVKKKQAIKFQKIYLLFAAFILLCGSTHLLDALMFWIPMYRLNALIRFFTAIVSVATVYYLVKILPEATRQKTNLELEKEIGRRQAAEANLSEANKSLESFAYIASHDLQEPLRKILLYSQMLYDKNESDFDPKSKDLAKKIISSSVRLKEMTKGVLNLSVLKDNIQMEMISLTDALNLALTDLENKIEEKKARIIVGDLPSVYGNLSYMSQLFLNLISNAIKFCNREPEIVIDADTASGKTIIRIRDNGIGMTEEGKKKIFFAFERLNDKSSYEGSGIGLAICERIINIHQGHMQVESSPGEGSTFIIVLKDPFGSI